jgi:hypothetical protein
MIKWKFQISNFIFIAIFTFSGLEAQMKSGYRFGVNLTTMSIKNGSNKVETNLPVGIHFGSNYEISLNKKFTFQTGFLFSSKGTDYTINNVYYSIAPSYFEIPVNSAYYFGRRKTKLAIFVGPYFSSAFGGYKIDQNGAFKYLLLGPHENNDLKCLDVGLNFGAGLHIKDHVFSIQYGIGLRNISPKNEFEMKNKVIGITVSSLK